MGQRVGYLRVSTVDQNTDRQLDGIALDKVFTDKASGKDTNRPELTRALEYVRVSGRVTSWSSTRWTGWRGTLKTFAGSFVNRPAGECASSS